MVFCRLILTLVWDLLRKFGHSDEGGSTFPHETSGLYEVCPLLGYYAAWSDNSLLTFREIYGSHLPLVKNLHDGFLGPGRKDPIGSTGTSGTELPLYVA
jgi:hypothetical protein